MDASCLKKVTKAKVSIAPKKNVAVGTIQFWNCRSQAIKDMHIDVVIIPITAEISCKRLNVSAPKGLRLIKKFWNLPFMGVSLVLLATPL